jgi:hypothetical protein
MLQPPPTFLRCFAAVREQPNAPDSWSSCGAGKLSLSPLRFANVDQSLNATISLSGTLAIVAPDFPEYHLGPRHSLPWQQRPMIVQTTYLGFRAINELGLNPAFPASAWSPHGCRTLRPMNTGRVRLVRNCSANTRKPRTARSLCDASPVHVQFL